MPVAGEEIEWVDRYERFAEIANSWDALASNEPTPFGRHAWFDCWWRSFGADSELAICLAWRGSELAAALPLERRGKVLTALANTHSPVFTAVAADREALDQVAVAAMTVDWRELVVPALPLDDRVLTALCDAASTAGRSVVVEPAQTSPIVEIEGSWEDYRDQMKSKWSSAERKARKMRRDHMADFSFVIAPEDLRERLGRGFRVEASGWKGLAGTAILSRPETSKFYRLVAEVFAATGELRLSEIRLDGKTVAFDLCLLDRGRLYLLKTGYDESYSQLSPGLVLRQQVVQRSFELGLEAHELLGDMADWKSRFATGARSHVRLRCYGRTPRGLAQWSYRRAKSRAVRIARSRRVDP